MRRRGPLPGMHCAAQTKSDCGSERIGRQTRLTAAWLCSGSTKTIVCPSHYLSTPLHQPNKCGYLALSKISLSSINIWNSDRQTFVCQSFSAWNGTLLLVCKNFSMVPADLRLRVAFRHQYSVFGISLWAILAATSKLVRRHARAGFDQTQANSKRTPRKPEDPGRLFGTMPGHRLGRSQ